MCSVNKKNTKVKNFFFILMFKKHIDVVIKKAIFFFHKFISFCKNINIIRTFFLLENNFFLFDFTTFTFITRLLLGNGNIVFGQNFRWLIFTWFTYFEVPCVQKKWVLKIDLCICVCMCGCDCVGNFQPFISPNLINIETPNFMHIIR